MIICARAHLNIRMGCAGRAVRTSTTRAKMVKNANNSRAQKLSGDARSINYINKERTGAQSVRGAKLLAA